MQNTHPQVDPNNPQPTPANPNPGPARTPTPPETPQREVPPGVPSPLPEPGPGPEPIGVPPTKPTEIPATPTTLNVHRGSSGSEVRGNTRPISASGSSACSSRGARP